MEKRRWRRWMEKRRWRRWSWMQPLEVNGHWAVFTTVLKYPPHKYLRTVVNCILFFVFFVCILILIKYF